MKLTKITAALIPLLLTLLPVRAAEETDLIEAARRYVPEDAEYIETERDGKYWEMEFRTDNEEYEITLSEDGKIIEIEFEAENRKGGSSFGITEDKVRTLILTQFPDAEKIRIRTENSRKKGCRYQVTFRSPDYRAESEINAETGEITEYEIRYRQ